MVLNIRVSAQRLETSLLDYCSICTMTEQDVHAETESVSKKGNMINTLYNNYYCQFSMFDLIATNFSVFLFAFFFYSIFYFVFS